MRLDSNPSLRRAVLGTALALSLTLLQMPPAAAQTSAFAAAFLPTGISWQPQTDYESLVLVVSGPDGFYLRQELDAATPPSLSLLNAQGNALADGVYSYELRTRPKLDAEMRAALAAVRANGDPDREAELAAKLPRGAVQSGYFSVFGGLLLMPDLDETQGPGGLVSTSAAAGPGSELTPMPSQVVLTNGDGVIRNSLCVGFDCPDSPVFSDSTILLMENNTRIKFGDTSNAPFPNNDWEIEANSSLSGGANYLGFNDCGTADNDGGCATDLVFAVESGARQNALYVESDGDVGFGTSNPVVNLHVVDGNTPTLRLEQDGSSGFAPQTWDVAGNETNFFIRDVTGGSTLPFRIQPGAPSSSIYIDNTGEVGIGTASPQNKVDVFQAAGPVGLGMRTNTQEWAIRTAANDNLNFSDLTNGGDQIRVQPGAASLSLIIANNGGGAVRVGINDTTPSGTLDVNGTIFLSGAQIHPDFVFEPGYELETIEEHAESMWKNKHLPAMGPGEYDENGQARFELGKHQVGLLEELEKAHIYIEQLHKGLTEKDAEISELRERLAGTEDLQERLTKLEELFQGLARAQQ